LWHKRKKQTTFTFTENSEMGPLFYVNLHTQKITILVVIAIVIVAVVVVVVIMFVCFTDDITHNLQSTSAMQAALGYIQKNYRCSLAHCTYNAPLSAVRQFLCFFFYMPTKELAPFSYTYPTKTLFQ